jgi:hypothetical protein
MKVIPSSTRCIRRTRKEGLRVYAGRVARVPLSMSHGCLLSLKKAGADKAEKGDTKPICFVSASSKRFSAHRVEDTTQQLAIAFVADVTRRRYLIRQDGLPSTLFVHGRH